MPEQELIQEKLEQIRDALERILRRSAAIGTPDDFTRSEDNLDKLDSIAMMLIAIGEIFKKIDKETDGHFLIKYPGIDWHGVKGVRDILYSPSSASPREIQIVLFIVGCVVTFFHFTMIFRPLLRVWIFPDPEVRKA
jgi:uncharacterized protein with HEPN domain